MEELTSTAAAASLQDQTGNLVQVVSVFRMDTMHDMELMSAPNKGIAPNVDARHGKLTAIDCTERQ